MPEHNREIFLLHYIEGFSYDEIERMTGVRQSALKMRVKRASDFLRARLTREAAMSNSRDFRDGADPVVRRAIDELQRLPRVRDDAVAQVVSAAAAARMLPPADETVLPTRERRGAALRRAPDSSPRQRSLGS